MVHKVRYKREGHSAKQKKHENTIVLKKTKRTICAFKCCLNCQLASKEALRSLEKIHQRSNAIVERCPFSASCRLTNDIRQNLEILKFPRITWDKHIPLKNLGWSRKGAFWRRIKKTATHVPGQNQSWKQTHRRGSVALHFLV